MGLLMVGSRFQFAVAALFSIGLSGCGTTGDVSGFSEDVNTSTAPGTQIVETAAPVECVPYARNHSGIRIYGDATTWWQQADGRYPRDSQPSVGSVIVLSDYSGPKHGHLAIVRGMDSARIIRVDHANWLSDGAIYLNDPIADVSPDNDWSAVKVWNARTGKWGTRTYLVQGFIGPAPDSPDTRVAQQDQAIDNSEN